MKNLFAFIGLAAVLSLVSSCKDKNNKSAITPDYGATGNPYPNNQTVTGSTTYTSPATQNTSFQVGETDPGWSNPTCASTGGLSLRATKDNVDVIVTFASAATAGTYIIGGSQGPGTCVLTVANAPNQPAGVYWKAKTGSVIVTTNATSINAKLMNVVCTQQEFNFPQVSVNGVISCSQ